MQVLVASSALWAILILFLASKVRKKTNILSALYLLVLVIICFEISDYIDYGFNYYQLFYIAEIVLIIISILFLSTKESKAWMLS